jgi:hypothetical protein
MRACGRGHICRLLALAGLWLASSSPLVRADSLLSPRNPEVPFSYLAADTRTWPIMDQQWPAETRVNTVIRLGDLILKNEQLSAIGLSVAVSEDGWLQVAANKEARTSLHLDLAVQPPNGPEERQTLEIRPAPPDRPISYYADFGDDLIRIFMNSTSGQFSPITKNGFDQYFRRLQAHGTRRLIVWLSPFPFITDSANYPPEDWHRYEQQARAILDDESLTRILNSRTGFATWSWLRYLLAARLNPDLGRMLGQSAEEHGIRLTVCYRPFEAALTKYYEVPAFDADGTYLWGFLPLASPSINYHPEQVGWRHYRDVLRDAGLEDAVEITTLELPGVTDPGTFAGKPGIRIMASPVPPLADDSFVLVREPSGEFRLRGFSALRDAVIKNQMPMDDVQMESMKDGLRLTGIQIPRHARYLIVSWTGDGAGPDLSALAPVVLRSKSGVRCGRETTWFVQGASNDPSRVAGITADGEYRAEFQASEASQRANAAGPERLTLSGRQLVIDFGAESTVEMIDFNQPLARQNAVREIATVLQQPGFNDILINTRSHVDLPVSLADGDQGVRPVGMYWHERRGPRMHLGLDKAYLPRSETSVRLIRELASKSDGIEQITTWQPHEWQDQCQSLDGPRWRYARNRGTADGIRLLLEDFQRAFPDTRTRMLIPPTEASVERITSGLDTLLQPDGKPYGRGYYDRLWPSNNHIPAIGEGAALLDLQGLSVEPVLFGSGGYMPDRKPFELYVRECQADLSANRGSDFRGPRSYFFEAQNSLRATDLAAARRDRETMICHLLAQRNEIGEVILYEAADWLYFLPLADPDLCGHGFLDRCEKVDARD